MAIRLLTVAVAAGTLGMVLTAQQPQPAPATTAPPPATAPQTPAAGPGRSTNLGADPNGNPLRLALKTGHVSNYDEAKAGTYTLPDPLVTAGAKPVRDAKAWRARRAEILNLYETHIYGRTPAKTPKVTWQVAETDPKAREGAALRKKIAGAVGSNV